MSKFGGRRSIRSAATSPITSSADFPPPLSSRDWVIMNASSVDSVSKTSFVMSALAWKPYTSAAAIRGRVLT